MKQYKIKKLILLFIALVLVAANGTVNVNASKNTIQVKVISVKNKQKCVKVKVNIVNNSKKDAIYGDEFSLYVKKSKKKWKKLKWKDNYAFNLLAYIIMPGGSYKKVFYIDKNAIDTRLKKNKKYMIKFKISGKTKRIKFNL